MVKPTTPGDVIQMLVQDYGVKAMLNAQFTLAAFMDLAPNLKREKELLRTFLLCNGAEQILGIQAAPFQEQKRCMDVLVSRMETEQWISNNAARFICAEFYRGVMNKEWTWETPKSEISKTESPKIHLNPPIPSPPSKRNPSSNKNRIMAWVTPILIVLALALIFKGCILVIQRIVLPYIMVIE